MPDTTISEISIRPFPDPRLQQLLVDIVASDGTVGTGECWWGIAASETRRTDPFTPHAAAVELLADRCVGRRTSEIERLVIELFEWAYRYGDGGIITGAVAGIDLALWDLLGKQLDLPVHSILGGPVHDRIGAYASLPPYHSAERVIAECDRARSAGFNAFKLHENDASIVLDTRAGLGDDATLMVDVNGCFDVNEAIEFGRAIAPANVLWYEEPVRPMRHGGAIESVARSQPVALAGGENEYSLADFDRLIRTGSLRWVQPEITKVGGLTMARKIGVVAQLHAVALCPHNFRIGPSLFASMHWGFTDPGTRWLELPWLPMDVGFPCGAELPQVDEGTVAPPIGPGLSH